MGDRPQEALSEAEIAKRRDEVIRRMANTKPKPAKKPNQKKVSQPRVTRPE